MNWGDRLFEDGIIKRNIYKEAFNKIKREDFLPHEMKKYSNADEPIPLFLDQTQTAPHMDAIFMEEALINEEDRVLEVGTGSGYLTALLAEVSKKVISIEFFKELSHFARRNLEKYHFRNLELIVADFYKLCMKLKFDKIIITAAVPEIPWFIQDMISPDGITIFPLGRSIPQKLIRLKNGKIENLGPVYFVNIIH